MGMETGCGEGGGQRAEGEGQGAAGEKGCEVKMKLINAVCPRPQLMVLVGLVFRSSADPPY